MTKATRILFVCLGNIVRSPLAENLFRQFAEQAGREDRYMLDSAGTSGWHVGEPPDRRMQATAAAHGYRNTGSARQIKPADLESFDLVIAMDRQNAADIQALADQAAHEKIHLLRQFDPQGDADPDVPDPYYDGADGFENTFVIVERSVRALFEKLEAEGR